MLGISVQQPHVVLLGMHSRAMRQGVVRLGTTNGTSHLKASISTTVKSEVAEAARRNQVVEGAESEHGPASRASNRSDVEDASVDNASAVPSRSSVGPSLTAVWTSSSALRTASTSGWMSSPAESR